MPPSISPQHPAKQPGGPGESSARLRAAVHAAVLALMSEGGPEALTLPAIAGRAGVTPTTITRRWGSVAELVAEVEAARSG